MNHGHPDKGSFETDRLHAPLRLSSRDALDESKHGTLLSSKIGVCAKNRILSKEFSSSSKCRLFPEKPSKSKPRPMLLAFPPQKKAQVKEIELSSSLSVSDISNSDPESYHEVSVGSIDAKEVEKANLQFSELLAREVQAVPVATTDSVAGSKASELETLIASVGSAVSDIYENESASQFFSLDLRISSVCSAVTGIQDEEQSAALDSSGEIRISCSVSSAASSICDPDEGTERLDLPFELELKSSTQSNGLVQPACEESSVVFTTKLDQDDCAAEKVMPLKNCTLSDESKIAAEHNIQSKSDEETMNIERAIQEDESALIVEDSEPTKITPPNEPSMEVKEDESTAESMDKVSTTTVNSKLKKGRKESMATDEDSSSSTHTLSSELVSQKSEPTEPMSHVEDDVEYERSLARPKLSKSDEGTDCNISAGEAPNARLDDELSVEHLESILAYEDSEGSICLDDDPEGPELASYAAALPNSLLSENGFASEQVGQQGRGSATSMSFADPLKNESRTKQSLSIASGDESETDDDAEQSRDDRRKSEALELADDKYGPNRPHPSLEYPILYFFLRRCPWLFDRIKILYAFRWRLSYPLQRKVPYSRVLRKIGIYLTWGELLLILPFFAAIVAGILYTVVFPSVIVTGKIARFGLIGALLFAQRNSLVTLLLGIPFDRAVFYHKLSGRVGGIVGLLHTVAYFVDPAFRSKHQFDPLSGAFTGQVNISGSVLMLLIAAITLSSLPPVRRRLFEVFYYLHVLFTAGMITCAFFHSGILVPILAILTWGADLFIRSIVMARTRYPRKAQVKAISETVVEISFPKTSAFAYNPGQYIYLAIPEISWLQWHPFSISSSPKQKVVTLHIRKTGNWTRALYDLAKTIGEVSILMEGPYGNVGVDIMGDRKYKNIMLISGGIGLTPMQSICDQLLYEKAKNRRILNNLKFIWIERDPILMQKSEFVRRTSSIGSVGSLEMEDYLSSVGSMQLDEADSSESIIESPTKSERNQSNVILEAQFRQQEHSIDIASQLLALVPPSKMTDEELDKIYESGDLVLDGDASGQHALELPTHESRTAEALSPTKKRPSFVVQDETSFADNGSPWLVEAPPVVESLMKVLDMQVYLTGDSPTVGIPYARFGRPDIKKIFLEMKRQAIAAGDNRVAVCVCAPVALTDLCHKACLVYSDDGFRFDFHSEVMTM